MGEEPSEVGWVSQPNTRGTFDIIVSCLFTIFVCCWTIVHPNIATPRASPPQRLLDKTICLLIAAFAPEVIVFISWSEYTHARHLTSRFCSKPRVGGRVWTVMHSFFAGMGGFTMASNDNKSNWENGWLSPDTLLALLTDGLLDPSDIPVKAVIEDKGKADSLVKAVALIQALWLLAQCIARAIQHLPITTIEIATLAYIPCAIIISVFWWSKPMDVNEPIPLRIQPEPVELRGMFDDNRVQHDQANPVSVVTYSYQKYPLASVSASAVLSVLDHINIWGLLTVFFCLVFGGLHCLAWNFHFPTPVERLLWRICSIIISVSIPAAWLTSTVVSFVLKRVLPNIWYGHVQSESYFHSTSDRVSVRDWFAFHRVIHAIGLILYVLARLYLIAEMFSSLRSQPAAAYITVEWTNFWPHG
ncbi:uncharacterized protein A1O9_01716 [Exophiala aquamarina CBS 119918]|uniref:Uncharacterized protein n=1 Tax=Exophiala aquamarina CBS 119918 TaxID=1182545 RepID=A0A072PWK4_9EURO|nr:uncharacterized protein A1O9_01716 [Exophiala aquamarina CBS 119918]KEF63738.1 hypothetical protein A1O9_01716 [Exophiala aquamarina CBS 119918]